MKSSHTKLNAAIIVLTVLLGIGYVIHSYLPEMAGDWVKNIASIMTPYLLAAIVLRVTLRRFMGLVGDKVDAERRLLLSKVYHGAAYAIATLVVLYQFGVELENLTLVLGLMTTAFALAIRDIIASYLTWYILLTKRPFKIGDYIKIGEDQGLVEHIGTFHVVLDDSPERPEDFIRVPNKTFLEKSIYNYGRSVPIDLRIPISMKNYDKKFTTIQEKIKARSGTSPKMWLESDKDGFFVRAEAQSTFEKRTKVRDTILSIVGQELGR